MASQSGPADSALPQAGPEPQAAPVHAPDVLGSDVEALHEDGLGDLLEMTGALATFAAEGLGGAGDSCPSPGPRSEAVPGAGLIFNPLTVTHAPVHQSTL